MLKQLAAEMSSADLLTCGYCTGWRRKIKIQLCTGRIDTADNALPVLALLSGILRSFW